MQNNQITYNIQAQIVEHRGKSKIALSFKYCSELLDIVKKFPGRTYSKSYGLWLVPNTVEGQNALRNSRLEISWNKKFLTIKEAPVKKIHLSNEWIQQIKSFEEYLYRQRYSLSSIKSYVMILTKFIVWSNNMSIQEVNNDLLVKFNDEFFIQGKFSRSYQNLWISALKLFLEKFTALEIDISIIERPRKAYQLPNILSESEIKLLIDSYKNLKHKAIIMTLYSCGLRKSELLNLKISDLDSKRMVVRIRMSKGAKDRDIAFPKALLKLLRIYYKKHKPKEYLIEGQGGGKYSAKSIDLVLRAGLKRINKPRKITVHGLRHSYATHLVERNINLRYIQEALGHRSSKTTEIYTKLSKDHIAQMVSPVDFWEDKEK